MKAIGEAAQPRPSGPGAKALPTAASLHSGCSIGRGTELHAFEHRADNAAEDACFGGLRCALFG